MNDRELLKRVADALAPLDAKIDHSLQSGNADQMRADLAYIRSLLSEARGAVAKHLSEPRV